MPVGEALTEACAALDKVFETHGYDAGDTVVFGHAKDGNIHFMITEDLGSQAGVSRYAGVHRGHGRRRPRAQRHT